MTPGREKRDRPSGQSQTAHPAPDLHKDRAIIAFTFLLIGLVATFALSLSYAEPSIFFNGLPPVQP